MRRVGDSVRLIRPMHGDGKWATMVIDRIVGVVGSSDYDYVLRAPDGGTYGYYTASEFEPDPTGLDLMLELI